jgi:ankyrin repeat protein
MWAAMYGEAPDIITALLDAGADAKVKDEKGKTAFDYALENWRMAGTEVIRRLEEASR